MRTPDPAHSDEAGNAEEAGKTEETDLTEGVTFSFHDIECKVQLEHSSKRACCCFRKRKAFALKQVDDTESGTKRILSGASGYVEAGEVLAILGSSGAGKTSLLDILAGRKTVGNVAGKLMLNGKQTEGDQVKQISAYVAQEDVLMPTLTVRETLEFIAELQIPSTVCATCALRQERVQAVIEALKLEKCAGTKVGSAFLQSRGISGGERRRVSIGIEILTDPQILFMDEPTSGLDSASALSLFDTLQDLALHKRMIVVATIHQPRSDIYNKFNKLMLLSEGYVAYQGNAGEDVLGFFGSFGLQRKSGWNTADWLVDVLADPGTSGSEWAKRFEASMYGKQHQAREEAAEAAAQAQGSVQLSGSITRKYTVFHDDFKLCAGVERSGQNGSSTSSSSIRRKHESTSFTRQYLALLRRHYLDSIRNPAVLVLQSLGYLSAAVFLGLLFGNLKTNARQQRATSYSFAGSIIIVFCFFAVPVYNQARAVFSREYASGFFRLSAYYTSAMTVQVALSIPLLVAFTAVLAWLQRWRLSHGAFWTFASITVLLQLGLFAMNETIGAFFSNLLVALAVSALFAIIFLLFNGVICAYANMPVYLRWLYWVCPTAYATSGYIIANYEDGDEQDLIFLEELDMPLRHHLLVIYAALVAWLVFWRILCFCVLLFFQKESR